MIKTIEIAPDIYVVGLAEYLAANIARYTYIDMYDNVVLVDSKLLRELLKEYMNE